MIRITYNLFYIIITFTFLSCGNPEKKLENSEQQAVDQRIIVTKDQFQKNNMLLGSATEKVFPTTIKVNGMIDVPPENKAVVNSIIGGYIKTVPLLVGDAVKKGQKLVTLENPEFVSMQQEYMEIKEQLNYLKSEYERQKTMYDENVVSEKKYLMAESQFKSANAKCNGLRKQLTMLNISPSRVEQGDITSIVTIYAPISGRITKVNVSKGSYVSPTNSILEIIDNKHVHIELSVFEKDIMKIKKNQNIQFTIPETSKDTFEAKVYLVGSAIEENRTIKVHGHPSDDSNTFLTGMFVNAEIIVDENTGVAVPETAAVEVEGNYFVLVLDEEDESNYYFNPLRVELGNTDNGYSEIKNKDVLKDSDTLLVNGAFSLIGIE